MGRLSLSLAALLAAIGATACTTAGCGSSHHESGSSANAIDRAFASQMTVHHQGALDMANAARQRSQHGETRTLAENIVSTQTVEISQLQRIAKQIGAKAGEGGHDSGRGHDAAMGQSGVSTGDLDTLGLSAEQAGMMHDARALDTAKPFDRAFIDMMVPHHQGAIRMARIELARGKNSKLKALAQAILAAQSREINQMNSWRRGWYGSASPAGGIPA